MQLESSAAGSPGDYATVACRARRAAEDLGASSSPRLLTRSAPVELARQYAEADTEALVAERTFKRWVIRANWAVLATATVSALLMAVALLAGTIGRIDAGNSHRARSYWCRSRRVRVDVAVSGEGGSAPRGLDDGARTGRDQAVVLLQLHRELLSRAARSHSCELLKLEYFRRYQLDLQLAYYKTRRSGHRNSAERTLSISAGSVLVAAIASGAAGVLGALRSEWAALGSLAVFGAALQAFAAARESLNQDRRNAERYDNTAQALQGLRERLDDVRLGIAAGSASVLGEYVSAVQDQLSLEHRQWLEGAENMQAAVARLEKALSSGASQKDSTSSGEGADH